MNAYSAAVITIGIFVAGAVAFACNDCPWLAFFCRIAAGCINIPERK